MSAYTDAVLATSGLVDFWKLDDAYGAITAADAVGANPGTRHYGKDHSEPAFDDVEPDRIYLTTATGIAEQWITIPNPASLKAITAEWSIELLVYRPDTASHGLLFGGPESNAVGPFPDANMTLTFGAVGFRKDGVRYEALDPAEPPLGWHRLLGTFDGTDLNLYRDGALVVTQAAAVTPNPGTGTPDWAIGLPDSEPPGGHLDASLQYVAVYDRALDAAEDLVHQGALGTSPSPVVVADPIAPTVKTTVFNALIGAGTGAGGGEHPTVGVLWPRSD